MNSVQRLVYMANQIAVNLAHDPDPVMAVADHIDKFWDPAMRRRMAEHGDSGLNAVAAAAFRSLKARG